MNSTNHKSKRVSTPSLSVLLYAAVLLCLVWALDAALTMAISISVGLLIAFRFCLMYFRPHDLDSLSRNAVKNVFSLLLIALIVSNGWRIGLLNAMVNLLMAGAALWWFTLPTLGNEASIMRHRQLTTASQKLTLCLLFLIAVAFIYQQSLQMSVLYFGLLIINIYGLLLVHNLQLSPSFSLKFMARETLILIPVTALLFILMPNLPPFWKLPEQQSASTGLNETMTPGDIANLAESNRLAFRVTFNSDQAPNITSLYWRVMTLERFDGETWTIHPKRKAQSELFKLAPNTLSSSYEYEVIAEPTQQPWLYSLRNSQSNTPNVYNMLDNKLVYNTKVNQRLKYRATSIAGSGIAPYNQLQPWEWRLNRQLVSKAHPRTRALADEIWSRVKHLPKDQQASAYSQEILNYFKRSDFRYSLKTQAMAGDHIDDFLFNKRVGFCAHFASAYTVLMRMQGFPTRIVTGYQGGEFNPNGNYFNVYDNSAHAWAEFWQSDAIESIARDYRGDSGHWLRVDPTAVVAPERLELGLAGMYAADPDFGNQPLQVVKSIAWLNAIRQQLQSLDYYWTIWVLDFDQQKRNAFFAKMLAQNIDWLSIIYGAIALVILPASSLTFVYMWRKRRTPNWLQRRLQRIENRLTRRLHRQTAERADVIARHIARPPHMTLMEYKALLIGLLPEAKEKIDALFRLIEFEVYCHSNSARRRQIDAKIKDL